MARWTARIPTAITRPPSTATRMWTGRRRARVGGIAADSLGPRRIGRLVFPIIQRFVRRVVLVKDDSTGEERAQSVIDAKQAAERIGQYKAEIGSLERDLVQYRREYDDYRNTVPATY